MWSSGWRNLTKDNETGAELWKKARMSGELEKKIRERGKARNEKRRFLEDYIGLPGKPHEPIRLIWFMALLLVTAGIFGCAWLHVWSGVQSVFLPMFLICLSILIAHDAYGNRLLPPPNKMAQIAGYLEALWCFALAAILLWRQVSS
jgi:hypothetical protein